MEQSETAAANAPQQPGRNPTRVSTSNPATTLLLAGILIVLILGTFGIQPAAPSWEYTIQGVPDLSFESTMEDLGDDGWELVFARRAMGSDDNMLYECIFKRRK